MNVLMESAQPRPVSRTIWREPRSENWWDIMIVEQSFEDSDSKKTREFTVTAVLVGASKVGA